ncbi:unnamed protein product [Prunus brigantina]
MIDFTRVEGMHSGDNGTEMNGLQMHSAPPILAHLETFSQVGVVGSGTTFELSVGGKWVNKMCTIWVLYMMKKKMLKVRIHGIIGIQNWKLGKFSLVRKSCPTTYSWQL